MKLFFIQLKKILLLLLMITAFGTVSGQIPVTGHVISADEKAAMPGG